MNQVRPFIGLTAQKERAADAEGDVQPFEPGEQRLQAMQQSLSALAGLQVIPPLTSSGRTVNGQ